MALPKPRPINTYKVDRAEAQLIERFLEMRGFDVQSPFHTNSSSTRSVQEILYTDQRDFRFRKDVLCGRFINYINHRELQVFPESELEDAMAQYDPAHTPQLFQKNLTA